MPHYFRELLSQGMPTAKSFSFKTNANHLTQHMDEFIGFTAREKYILNAYRDRELSEPSRYIVWELSYIIPSLLFVSFYFWYQDIIWVFVGYALLLLRLYFRLKQTLLFIESYRTIFLKYETKITELMDVQREGE